jgi:hypothetical protein
VFELQVPTFADGVLVGGSAGATVAGTEVSTAVTVGGSTGFSVTDFPIEAANCGIITSGLLTVGGFFVEVCRLRLLQYRWMQRCLWRLTGSFGCTGFGLLLYLHLLSNLGFCKGARHGFVYSY